MLCIVEPPTHRAAYSMFFCSCMQNLFPGLFRGAVFSPFYMLLHPGDDIFYAFLRAFGSRDSIFFVFLNAFPHMGWRFLHILSMRRASGGCSFCVLGAPGQKHFCICCRRNACVFQGFSRVPCGSLLVRHVHSAGICIPCMSHNSSVTVYVWLKFHAT